MIQKRPNAERDYVERGFAAKPAEKRIMQPLTPLSALLNDLFLQIAKSTQNSPLGGHCKFPRSRFARLGIPAAIYRSAQGPGPESAPRSAFFQSRKCAINNFWTKNPRGLLG